MHGTSGIKIGRFVKPYVVITLLTNLHEVCTAYTVVESL